MSKFIRKNITVDAIKLLHPTSITTPMGVIKGIAGDYLVTAGGEQFIITKTQFELTYESQLNPDTLPPLEISDLVVDSVSDQAVSFTFKTPADADLQKVNIYQDGTLIFEGVAETFTVGSLTPQTTYTFLFTTEDTSGNESTGIARSVTTIASTPTP